MLRTFELTFCRRKLQIFLKLNLKFPFNVAETSTRNLMRIQSCVSFLVKKDNFHTKEGIIYMYKKGLPRTQCYLMESYGVETITILGRDETLVLMRARITLVHWNGKQEPIFLVCESM